VVPWVNDQDVPFCPDCGNKFSIRNRRHHCRLCGSIMCKKCMELISLPLASKWCEGGPCTMLTTCRPVGPSCLTNGLWGLHPCTHWVCEDHYRQATTGLAVPGSSAAKDAVVCTVRQAFFFKGPDSKYFRLYEPPMVSVSLCHFFLFFFVDLGDWTQGLAHARQTLYHVTTWATFPALLFFFFFNNLLKM
jgi:hypothetical protein